MVADIHPWLGIALVSLTGLFFSLSHDKATKNNWRK
jgi:hypothetical protein